MRHLLARSFLLFPLVDWHAQAQWGKWVGDELILGIVGQGLGNLEVMVGLIVHESN